MKLSFRNTYFSNFLFAVACTMFFASVSMACDRSHLQVDNVVDLGSGQFRIEMTMCTGGGSEGGAYGADQNTGNFAFEVAGATVASFQPTVTSPQTGAGYVGFFPTSGTTLVGYQNSDDWFACINDGCGGLQTVCASVYLITNGMPTKITLKGMEGADNIQGGCTGSDMEVMPSTCGAFTADAGSDVSTTKNKCKTLTASATGTGVTYTWSTGQTGASIQVCPKSTTIYTVTASNSSGCSATDDVTVTVKGGGKPKGGGDAKTANLKGHGKSKK